MMQSKESLKQIPLLAGLPPVQLELVAETVEPLEFDKGSQLLESGTDDGYTYFLSEGELLLDAGEGETLRVRADSETAAAPLANLRPRLFGVKALSFVRAFRVPDIVLSVSSGDGAPKHIDDPAIRERYVAESRLSIDLYRDLRSEKLVLPSLPDVAFRIRKAIDDEASDARTVARLVEADPAIAGKVLKAANSALYGGMGSVQSVSSAVVRLGMKTTRQLVMTFALREVFRTKNAAVRQRMTALWKHSTNVAALCFVLARRVDDLDPEEALLVGLVHDLGEIPILSYASRYPMITGDGDELELTARRMRGELGAMILRLWSFAPTAVAAARDAEYWLRSHDRAADVTDLLIVAQVHERLRKQQTEGLPPLEQISALGRVLGSEVSPEKSLEILHDAKEQIDEMRQMLGG